MRNAISNVAEAGATTHPLDQLAWWRVRATVECARTSPNPSLNALEVLTAFAYGVKVDGSRPHLVLRTPGRALQRLPLRRGINIDLEFLLFCTSDAEAGAWRDSLAERLAMPDQTNFLGLHVGMAEPRSLRDVPEIDRSARELCLDFLTPFPFRRAAGSSRTTLSKDVFLGALERRVERIAGHRIPCDVAHGGWELLHWFWHFEEIKRSRNTHRYGGCVGPLYLKGDLTGLGPWLRLVAELHLVDRGVETPSIESQSKRPATALGYFVLRDEPNPWFDTRLADTAAMRATLAETLRQNDSAAEIAEAGVPFDETRFADQIAAELASGEYLPRPTQAFRVQKRGGGERLIERLTPRDLAAQRRIAQLLAPVLDLTFSEASLGYRKGRSRDDALALIRAAANDGCRFVVEADIEDFFPSIDHAHLETAVDRVVPAADSATRSVLLRMVRMPFIDRGATLERERGLAQGSPLSPLLANLYLDSFDRELTEGGAKLVRFADDFVILARSREEAESVLRKARAALESLGLGLKEGKTGVRSVDEGFDFLGERIDGRTVEDPVAALLPHRKPLIITEPYLMLGINGDALDIRRSGELVETIPLRRVSEMIVFGKVSFSSALVEKLARFRIPLSFALESGYQIGTFAPDSRAFFDIAHWQAARYHEMGETARTAIAARIASTKIENYCALIQSRYRAGDARLVAELAARIEAIGGCDNVAAIRGHEGLAARTVFAWLNEQLPPAFQARRRERGAPDRLNSMLNFGYYLSYTRLNGLMRAHGLNPYLGFLHDAQDDYETLVADLQEVFRPHWDRVVIRLVNTRAIGENDFVSEPGRGHRLSRGSMRRHALEFEREMARDAGGVPLRDAMTAQVRGLRSFFTEGTPLWLYRWRNAGAGVRRGDGTTDIASDDTEGAM